MVSHRICSISSKDVKKGREFPGLSFRIRLVV